MKIAPDKWRHFYAGIVMGIVLQAAGWWWMPSQVAVAAAITFVIVVAVSYGFELFSKITGKGHYEVMDAVASVFGGLVGMGVILLLQLIF
ncbi:MAG TPA: hypothetical protein VGD17_00200 [Chitinophagaceae bacterium]